MSEKPRKSQGDSRELQTRRPDPTPLSTIDKPRIEFHPMIAERFGVDEIMWPALIDAVFPLATSVDSVALALSYCKARRLDPFKKVVHIVPVYSSKAGRMVETIWPGIAEVRITATRTGQYAGKDETTYGPDMKAKVGTLELTFPQWAQVTVYRTNAAGEKMRFVGERVYWLETYARKRNDDPTPNSMWAGRPHGQLAKCAEAEALREAFPEEAGGMETADEARHDSIDAEHRAPGETNATAPSTLDKMAGDIERQNAQSTKPADAAKPPDPINWLGFDLDACKTIADVNAVAKKYAMAGLERDQLATVNTRCDERRKALKTAAGETKAPAEETKPKQAEKQTTKQADATGDDLLAGLPAALAKCQSFGEVDRLEQIYLAADSGVPDEQVAEVRLLCHERREALRKGEPASDAGQLFETAPDASEA